MFSLLFLDEPNSEILSLKSVKDLQLEELFNSNTINILTKKCSNDEILARQSFFKSMDNKAFFDNLYDFHLGLKSLVRNKKNLMCVNNDVEYYFCFLNYAKEYTKIIQKSEFLIIRNLAVIDNFKKDLELAIDTLNELAQLIFEFENHIQKYKKLVLTYNENINFFVHEKDVYSQLLYISQKMELDVVSNCKSKNRTIPKNIVNTIISKETKDHLIKYIEKIESLLNEDIYYLIPDLDFYFNIYSLKTKAYEYNIPSCYPTISDEPCFIAKNVFNISLIDTIKDKIVPNDVFFTNEKNFFILTGANSGGKTSYLKAIAINLLLFLGGCPIFCSNAKIYPFSKIFTHFCSDEKNTKNGSFNDEYQNIKSLVDTINNFDDCFILFNEPLTTTNSVKAETLICEMVDSFYNKGRFGLLITHFHSIANMNIPSLHVVVNNKDDNLRTYKIENGSASSSYAIDILKKYKLDNKSLGCGFNNE